MIAVIGCHGNMGKRYCAILNELKERCLGIDIHNVKDMKRINECKGVIIATPTNTHYSVIKDLYKRGVCLPVLCEKPLTKSMEQLEHIKEMMKQIPLTMVMQYQFAEFTQYTFKTCILEQGRRYDSYYNHYKHGQDGLLWDCIQIIGLAEGNILIKEDSPVWDCMINGARVDGSSMDRAYIKMIKHWLENPRCTDDILEMHRKVNSMIGVGNEKCLDWYTSKDR